MFPLSSGSGSGSGVGRGGSGVGAKVGMGMSVGRGVEALVGRSVAMPSPRHSEYEGRCRIHDLDSFQFGPEGAEIKIYRFGTSFGNDEQPIHVLFYLPEKQCDKGYEPREGDEIDVVFWLQGRIADVGDEMPETEVEQ